MKYVPSILIKPKFMCACLTLIVGSLFFANAVFAKSPNVLLIITDDQGFGDVASHGNSEIQTPVHDRLASEGVRFDRYYVSPVCAPTRAALLTGRYHPRTSVHGVTRGHEVMRDDEVTIAEVLKANGYSTGAFGKWHNGESYPHHPNGQGFDEFIGFCAGHWNNYFDTPLERNGEVFQSEGFIIDTLTDYAIDWIQKQNEANQPWFCYLPYNTPHTPWQVPEKFWKKYQGKGLESTTACAYAMVENIDFNMGRLLASIDEMQQRENTIVVFMTDNGANTDRFNAGMRGRKGSNHEGGTRVPLFIRYPNVIPEGLKVKEISAHIDILPTLVELTGSNSIPTKPLDGKSLVPLIHKQTGSVNKIWPERTLFTVWKGKGAARTQKWRAVDGGKSGWILFDMQNDPDETKNVAEKNSQVLNELVKSYEQWWAEVSTEGFDPIPTVIGHSDRPETLLSAHYAYLEPAQGQGISYQGANGWANDYVTNWTSAEAYAQWPVEVVNPGQYEVSIDYIADEEAVGSVLQVELAGQKAFVKVKDVHNPPVIPSPDRIPRKEVYAKEWNRLKVGMLNVEQTGTFDLRLKGLSKPGKQFPEIKTIILRRIID